MGRLIPAGTGAYVNKIRKVASDRDQITLAAQQQAAALEQDEIDLSPESLEAPEMDSDAKEAANG